MSYLELVVDAFEYCHDFYFPKPEEIDYQSCGEQILNQVAMWKKNQVDTFSSDEVLMFYPGRVLLNYCTFIMILLFIGMMCLKKLLVIVTGFLQ